MNVTILHRGTKGRDFLMTDNNSVTTTVMSLDKGKKLEGYPLEVCRICRRKEECTPQKKITAAFTQHCRCCDWVLMIAGQYTVTYLKVGYTNART